MKTITHPRRAMRPHPEVDPLPDDKCAWCGKKPGVGRGKVFTRGFDMGKTVVVCADCLGPPAIDAQLSELTDGQE